MRSTDQALLDMEAMTAIRKAVEDFRAGRISIVTAWVKAEEAIDKAVLPPNTAAAVLPNFMGIDSSQK